MQWRMARKQGEDTTGEERRKADKSSLTFNYVQLKRLMGDDKANLKLTLINYAA